MKWWDRYIDGMIEDAHASGDDDIRFGAQLFYRSGIILFIAVIILVGAFDNPISDFLASFFGAVGFIFYCIGVSLGRRADAKEQTDEA